MSNLNWLFSDIFLKFSFIRKRVKLADALIKKKIIIEQFVHFLLKAGNI